MFTKSVNPAADLSLSATALGPTAYNGSAETYPRDLLVPQLVGVQAALHPYARALTADNHVLSYLELDNRANQIAHHLRSFGIGPDTPVGICLERSVEQVLCALGILKADAAYLPMDPAYPAERLAFMLNDARAPVLLTKQHLAKRLPAGKWRVIDLDVDASQISCHPIDSPESVVSGTNVAYVIYTSGSTGLPKGVEITHGSLLNLLFWHQRAFSVKATDRASQLASPGFDAAVWELWPYLIAGASVSLPSDAIRNDPEALRNWLVAQGITIVFVPTPLAERMIDLQWPSETALRILLTGGDTLHKYPPPGLPFTVINNYGPTECTVVASSGPVLSDEHPEGLPAIGRPIANTQIHILNEQMQRVPIGVAGEMYIGGAGVARGYLNRSELTRQKFVPDPFSCDPKSRLYKTGDLGRYLPDSQIAFLGRLDDQLKIRGYRIEPNEIVSALNDYRAVLACAVAAREDSRGDKYLIGYVVLDGESQPTAAALQEFLRQRLPDYMVPAVFVKLESLPLMPSGKVDREALPLPSDSNILRDEQFLQVRTLVEKRVAGILAELLSLQQVGVDDDFFLLGGHSLLATQVVAQIDDAFGIELTLRDVFEAPTVAELSDKIERLLLAKVQLISEDDAQRILGDR